MSSRILVGGRVIALGNPRRIVEQAPGQTLDEYVAPQRRQPTMPLDVTNVWEDGFKIRHRIVTKLVASEGWQELPVIASWFGIQPRDARTWAARGLLDCAVEKGSTVGLYRVLDAAVLRAEAALLRRKKKSGP